MLTNIDGQPVSLNTTYRKLTEATTDEQLVTLFLAEKNMRSPNSARAYSSDLSLFFSFVNYKALNQISYDDLMAYYKSLEDSGFKQTTINRRLNTVKSLFTFGCRLRYLVDNPVAIIPLPATKNTIVERILSVSQIFELIYLEPSDRNKLIMRFLYCSGGRVAEVCALTWKDLRSVESTGSMTGFGYVNFFGKGNKNRVMAISRDYWAEVMGYKDSLAEIDPKLVAPNAPVFYSRMRNVGNGALKPNGVRKLVKIAGQRIGIENLSPHWFRHSHATHTLERGANTSQVKITLGHSSTATTDRYLHLQPDDGSGFFIPKV